MNSAVITNTEAPETDASLLSIQREMAGIFADLADLFGNPSSLGSIYGLLFASPEPLSMEEIVDRLDISTGTASQGLRRLVEMQAITPRKEEGERVTRYEAKLELRPFVAMFLEQQLLPKIGNSAERIEALQERLSSIPKGSRDELGIRLERASKWHRRAKTFLPLVRKFLGG